MDWLCEIQYLKGVGPKRAELYRKLEIETVYDLLHTAPRTYLNLTRPLPIADCPLNEPCAVVAVVAKKSPAQRVRGGMTLYKIRVTDGSSDMTVTYFNSQYAADKLKEGEQYLFFGKMTGNLLRREMGSPLAEPLEAAGGLYPIYGLTAGLTNRIVQSHVKNALEQALPSLEDPLPERMRTEYQLCHLTYALQNLHFPAGEQELEIARARLAFEELLLFQLGMAKLSEDREEPSGIRPENRDLGAFYAALPFALTGAQRRVIEEIAGDLGSGKRMNRLVQGDVGSGKTMVAAAAAVMLCQNGWQAALMAPTEILAEQHFRSLAPLFEQLGMRAGLLTGSMKKREKDEIKRALAAGEMAFVVGTHALIVEDVAFAKIGLVITDEQHRFGVKQRSRLGSGGEEPPHTLVMSATPIPRTLALMLYGDLDVSVIDELPGGRKAIETYLIDAGKRERAYGFIRRYLDEGRQAYLVCPLVEEGETGLVSVEEYYREAVKGPFAGYRVGLLHGKLPAKEKDRVMRAFSGGELDVLIATTVIEVGVDVPNAVVMLIENAERFGLSQLHQLRGRIGRGEYQSFCILVSDHRAPETRERLKFLCKSTDGFQIAEFDLQQRGPGDFFGSRQSGALRFKVADVFSNMEMLRQAREACQGLLREDPELEGYPLLRRLMERFFNGFVG